MMYCPPYAKLPKTTSRDGEILFDSSDERVFTNLFDMRPLTEIDKAC